MSNVEPMLKPDDTQAVVITPDKPAPNEPHEIIFDTVKNLKRGEKVAIFTQDNPDPDAIGSAFGLAWLIRKINSGVSVHIYYGGEISHPQNRTFVNLLNIQMRRVDGNKDYEDHGLKIFVDVASSGQKNLQSITIQPDIIIDHHEDNPEGDYILKDIRVMGATATIISEYILKAGYQLSEESEEDVNVATALLFAIENDTGNLVSENTRQLDIDCFLYLLKRVDINIITNVRNYPIPRYFFELEEIANQNKKIVGSVLVTGLEFLKPDRRDALPYIADKFLRMEGIETVVVFGIIDDHLVASLRTTNKSISLNSICHSIFGESYSGAKTGSGGARVPLGLMAPKNAKEEVRLMVWEALKTKLTAEIIDKISGQ
ncbi:Bifunctional oligoribonuclease/PAP phosphatase NrnA [Sulfidibacter corallicola]|uniref:Bifunctional oligoribonuclease/PAP phosphatase NrnA n=1 Tax=Sulfidibacter corallicola TaxID=2818388 RepID=A0A8A4TPY8_SULCO|nr:bifunctional oligoribonuclease/PAP phosphatase NrnA [Sulfidibacter corallicola]QTD51613.1 bifunctional oligoribonuclease/PAP phosphatase NrnA [Sulfidibacter corallicola]